MTNRPPPPLRMRTAQAMLGAGLLGIVAELATGYHWILPGSVALAIGGALLGLNRLTCPKCGYKQTVICSELHDCTVCQTALSPKINSHDHPG